MLKGLIWHLQYAVILECAKLIINSSNIEFAEVIEVKQLDQEDGLEFNYTP